MARVETFQTQKMHYKPDLPNSEGKTTLEPEEQKRQKTSKMEDKSIPKLIINCSMLTSTIKPASSKSSTSPNAGDSGSKISSDAKDYIEKFQTSIADKVKLRKRGTKSAEASAHLSSKLEFDLNSRLESEFRSKLESDLVSQRRKSNLSLKHKTDFLTRSFSPVKDTGTVSTTLSSPSISNSEILESSYSSNSTFTSINNANNGSDSKIAGVKSLLTTFSKVVNDKCVCDSESQLLKSPHPQTDSDGLFPMPTFVGNDEIFNREYVKWFRYIDNTPFCPMNDCSFKSTLNALNTTEALKLIPTTSCSFKNKAEKKLPKTDYFYDADSAPVPADNFDPDIFLNHDWKVNNVATKESSLKVPYPSTSQASPVKVFDISSSELNVASYEEVASVEPVPDLQPDESKPELSDILEPCPKLYVGINNDGIVNFLDEIPKIKEEEVEPSIPPLSQASESVKQHSCGVEEKSVSSISTTQCITEVSKKTNGLTPAVHEDQNDSHQWKTKRRRSSTPRESERIRDMNNRHIVYVGDIPQGYTQEHLQKRFQVFGTIKDIKLCYKECDADDICVAMNSNHSLGYSQIACLTPNKRMKVYAFITFTSLHEAMAAIDHGNKGQSVKLNINFGARRHFVGSDYTDLDGNLAVREKRKWSYISEDEDEGDEDDYTSMLMQEQKRRGLSPWSLKHKCHS